MVRKNDPGAAPIPESKSAAAKSKILSRRQFLKGAGVAGLGAASMYLMSCTQQQGKATGDTKTPTPTAKRDVFVANATMMVVGDPTRCVGCRRCEIACTDYNEGKTQPSLARVEASLGSHRHSPPLLTAR